MELFSWLTNSGPLVPPVAVGTFVSISLVTTPGSNPVFSILSGNLPEGLILDSGIIYGTPKAKTTSYTSTFVIRATSLNQSSDRSFSITVLPFDKPIWPYPNTVVYLEGPNIDKTFPDFSYVNEQLLAVPQGPYDITYRLTDDSGKLPPGLTLSSTGTLSGIINDPIKFNIKFNDTYVFSVIALSDNMAHIGSTQTFAMTLTYVNVANTPIFIDNQNLGTYRAETKEIIPIQTYNPVPSAGSLVYSQIGGSLPQGLNVDTTAGAIYGFISTQTEYLKNYEFIIAATKNNIYQNIISTATQNYEISIIKNNHDIIEWITDSNLGTIHTSVPSILNIVATHTETVHNLQYYSVGNNFPNGLILKTNGEIHGSTTNTGTYTVTIVATTGTAYTKQTWDIVASSKIYPVAFNIKNFNINVIKSSLEYTNIYVRPFLSIDQRLAYQQFIDNTDIFENQYIYRPTDLNFGVQKEFKMYMYYGLQKLTSIADYQSVFLNDPILNNQKNLHVGDPRIITAIDSLGQEIYDVVYLNVVDAFQRKSILDKIRIKFSSLLADEDPVFLPIWQKNSSEFIYGVVLCYTNPKKGIFIINNIKKYLKSVGHLDFHKINFTLDRFIIEQTLSSTSSSYLILPSVTSDT